MLKLCAGMRKGAGRNRDYHAIKRWMDENDIAVSQVSRDLGLHPTATSAVIPILIFVNANDHDFRGQYIVVWIKCQVKKDILSCSGLPLS
jgi:hypothetical protein